MKYDKNFLHAIAIYGCILIIGVLSIGNWVLIWQTRIEQINRTEKVYKTPEELNILRNTILKEFDGRFNEHIEQMVILNEIKEVCSQ